jgi:hypothetical protein
MSSDKIEWELEAEKRLAKVPVFVRKMAKSKIEKAAKAHGITTITVELMEKIKKEEME